MTSAGVPFLCENDKPSVGANTSNLSEQVDVFLTGSLFASQDEIEMRSACEGQRCLIIGRMSNAPNQRIKDVGKHRVNFRVSVDKKRILLRGRVRCEVWRGAHVSAGIDQPLKLKSRMPKG